MRMGALFILLAASGANLAPPRSALPSSVRNLIRSELDGTSEQVRVAIERIQKLEKAEDRAEFGVLLLHVLERGVREDLAPPLLKLAAQANGETSRATVAVYLKHRTASVRAAAAQALGLVGSTAAMQALGEYVEAERDPAARRAGLEALAHSGGPVAESALNKAWAHGDVDALVLLAGSCSECTSVLQAVRAVQFETLTKVVRTVFARTNSESVARVQLEVARALVAMQSRDAKELLRAVRKDYATTLGKPVLKVLDAELQ